MRKLATVRTISSISPIEGKDRIVQYNIGGWLVIDQKDKYAVGDSVIYIEPDSWVPTYLAPFLSRGKEPREYLGVKGEKLKTIKMGGAISQGLIIPIQLDASPPEGEDVSEELGIVKWEPPPEFLQANARGNFPSFIFKTDQERVQNIYKKIDFDDFYEVTEKLEGQSFTAYFRDGEYGICSRNLELKKDEVSTFANTAKKYNLENILTSYGRNIALQGEQVGPGIEGNIYRLNEVRLYIYDIFDIDKQEYLLPDERRSILAELGLLRVPVLYENFTLGEMTVDKILDMAFFQSLVADVVAEGMVFKSVLRNFSFKAVSNLYLANDKKSTPWKN